MDRVRNLSLCVNAITSRLHFDAASQTLMELEKFLQPHILLIVSGCLASSLFFLLFVLILICSFALVTHDIQIFRPVSQHGGPPRSVSGPFLLQLHTNPSDGERDTLKTNRMAMTHSSRAGPYLQSRWKTLACPTLITITFREEAVPPPGQLGLCVRLEEMAT